MPDEITVWRNGRLFCRDESVSKEPIHSKSPITKYIRADKAVPEGKLIQIERLQEAVEFRREIAEFGINRVKNFFGMNEDKPEVSLDAILWMAACEYLKLISSAPQPPTKGD